jgi:hypothetical protein
MVVPLLPLVVMVAVFALRGLVIVAACFAAGFIVLMGGSRLMARSAWTEVNSEGISYFGGLGRTRHIPWHDIDKIDIRRIEMRAGTVRQAQVTCTGGRRSLLPMLGDSAASPDPQFEQRVDQLNQLLRIHQTRSVGRPATEASSPPQAE